jgi:hypothetical protein
MHKWDCSKDSTSAKILEANNREWETPVLQFLKKKGPEKTSAFFCS